MKTKQHIKIKKSLKTTSFPVRICVVQYRMRRITSFENFAEQCQFFIDVAADYKSDFVLFPELMTTQLLVIIKAKDTVEGVKKISTFTPKYVALFKRLAKEYNINIIPGSHFVKENNKIYNVSYLFRRDGSYDTQKKIHITPSEKEWWGVSAGNNIKVIETDCGKVSIQICYDIEFPEMGRIAASKGAKIIFNPYSTDDRHGYVRVINCAKARAIENQVYVACAGIVGNLVHIKNMDDIRYGKSGIYTPSDFSFPRDGVAGECEPNIETVVVADVDLEVLDRNRKNGTVLQLRDMRNDLYELKIKKKKR
ncbi:MAG: carbon-nitrogen hydrolase family protein [Nanoarchaeota archaeon]|nr:carbon-nitrogen hydrolase family protein [Nanoarchaeota archaeon]MBU1269522.1 carbon-nitrogen hydrolase family protein [Nanoarchaeota archaeon]MBU1604113.1 carbon-nitrogen hydrolase family protein [Nanoarchaeota archaeon]MBU2442817.1 carbon-nitrogen hydrolase family protein [Nanoarchaeota archaeon]